MNKNIIIAKLRNRNDRSQWDKGVTAQAIDMLEGMEHVHDLPQGSELETLLLDNAGDWYRYSSGGNALIANYDIAHRYMTPSELKRYNAPGHDASMGFCGESLLELQARACKQAYMRIRKTIGQYRYLEAR